jgi:hypothetical protein
VLTALTSLHQTVGKEINHDARISETCASQTQPGYMRTCIPHELWSIAVTLVAEPRGQASLSIVTLVASPEPREAEKVSTTFSGICANQLLDTCLRLQAKE